METYGVNCPAITVYGTDSQEAAEFRADHPLCGHARGIQPSYRREAFFIRTSLFEKSSPIVGNVELKAFKTMLRLTLSMAESGETRCREVKELTALQGDDPKSSREQSANSFSRFLFSGNSDVRVPSFSPAITALPIRRRAGFNKRLAICYRRDGRHCSN